MVVKVLQGWANCTQFLIFGEFVSMPDQQATALIKDGVVAKADKVPEGTEVRDIADNLVTVV